MYGIFSNDSSGPRMGYKHGDTILDLAAVASLGLFDTVSIHTAVFSQPALNDFIASGKTSWQAVGQRINQLLANNEAELDVVRAQVLLAASRATMHLPVRIGDYTDFYAGIHHAENVGRLFRPDGDPLLPNYRHMPVAYHGRSSSIVVSGTPIRRPNGQQLGPDGQPVFGPSRALDFELELGLIIGKSNPLGEPIPVDAAEEYIFGITLFNDWSARDIQRWEYQPLGPFLGKNFGSSLSAWVMPFADLEPFRVAGPAQEPAPLSYLQTGKDGHFNVALDVVLQPAGGSEVVISQSNARHLYWSFAQMIAHHTVNGCNLTIGDVLATGTISGSTPNSAGSLLELSYNGKQPLALPDNRHRTFLENGDRVTLRGWAGPIDKPVQLGDVTGQITPSPEPLAR
ncbi:fumarylacetoacetase [Spirosoma rigui]|uniref:fumarylacetoacetase n=1 Tax=Spirosoma rigui TaxID=564064 RepID=UPI0009B0B496|nr:fumarylacetoacetase [Spirosoma rigui]